MRATLTNQHYARLTAWQSGTSELWKESSNCYEADAISPQSSALRFSEFNTENTENTEIKRSNCPAGSPLRPCSCWLLQHRDHEDDNWARQKPKTLATRRKFMNRVGEVTS